MTIKINLGAGMSCRDGYVNVDAVAYDGIDVIHDLNEIPWPFDDCMAEEILALDVFEHLDNLIAVMDECHRILAPDGRLKIRGPAHDSPRLWEDVTHRRAFTTKSFDHFDPDTLYGKKFDYGTGKWRKLQSRKKNDGNIVFYMERRNHANS